MTAPRLRARSTATARPATTTRSSPTAACAPPPAPVMDARARARRRASSPPRSAPRSHARGIRFASVDGDDTWHVDPVPRVIPADEWEPLAAGLAQRVRALNAFVADVYGERRIVAEGVMPQRVLDTAEHLEPAMQGFRPRRDGVWIGIAGLDIVRDGDGHVARARGQRAHAERARLLARGARGDGHGARAAARGAAALDRRPRRRAAPRARRRARAVVLTDGPDNSAHWEHAWIAERLGIPLADARPTSRCAASRLPASRRAGRRASTGARTRTRWTARWGAAPAGRGGGRRRAGQLLRHRRRRRQARPRLRPRHDPLLPRARSRCSTRSRRSTSASPRRSSARSTCSTSS